MKHSPFPSGSDKDALWHVAYAFIRENDTPPTSPSPIHEMVVSLIDRSEETQRATLLSAIADALGDDFRQTAKSRTRAYATGMPLVPLKNPNDHNYELGETVIFGTQDGGRTAFCLKNKGKDIGAGNNLPDFGPTSESVRLATCAELESFLRALTDENARILRLLLGAAAVLRRETHFPIKLREFMQDAEKRIGETAAASSRRRSRGRSRRPFSSDEAPPLPPDDSEMPGL